LRDRFISSQRFIKVYLLTRLSFSRRLTLVVFGLASLLVFASVFNYNFNFTFTAQAAGTPGTVDLTFNPGSGANGVVYALAVQGDGKVVIGGDFTAYNGTDRNRIARVNGDGSLDTTFNPGTGVDGRVWSLAVQGDGKVVIGGDFTVYNGTTRTRIARVNGNGTLDTTFNPGSGANDTVYAMVVQGDGKVVIGGKFTTYNGTDRNRIARLNGDGTLDTTFNPGTGVNGIVWAMALQSNGKILVGGNFNYSGTAHNGIVRLNGNGTLDTTFNPGSGANGVVYALALQGDGKILIGGDFTSYNGTDRSRIARLNSNGTLDATFKGPALSDAAVYALGVQSAGKTLIGGAIPGAIFRLDADGSLDTTFRLGNGNNGSVLALAVQDDSKVVIGGNFTSVDSTARNNIARLESSVIESSTLIQVKSSPNPSTIGQSVTITAMVLPKAATGTVTFTIGAATVPVTLEIGGVATYVTNTLPYGSHTITATYSGNVGYASSTTNVQYIHRVVPSCNSLEVTAISDDGVASTCGTLSFALLTATSGETITFALTQGNTITFTGSLTPTVPAGVTLDGGGGVGGANGSGITLEGSGVAGNGLRLSGGNTLTNLTIRHFGGQELVIPLLSPNNRLSKVRLVS
jgi:uncharacterized delta-60 repeat protein